MGIASLTLGITSLVFWITSFFSWIGIVAGIPIGVAGIILAVLSLQRVEPHKKKANAGLILSVIGLIGILVLWGY